MPNKSIMSIKLKYVAHLIMVYLLFIKLKCIQKISWLALNDKHKKERNDGKYNSTIKQYR